MVEEAYKRAKEASCTKYRKQLDAVAQKLLEVETLDREEFEGSFRAAVAQEERHAAGRVVAQVSWNT